MEAVARARFVRVPPRKARQIADLIRGKTVNQALSVLLTVPRKASKILEKTLDSAVANAVLASEDTRLDPDTLIVSDVSVDQGPIILRWRPRARGRATRIRHRTSHITIKLASTGDSDPGEEK
jgi:large subunit ribosomal protein L22